MKYKNNNNRMLAMSVDTICDGLQMRTVLYLIN